MTKDYYNILGVSKSATKDDIKKAFHKMAHQYHPDKKGGDEKKFKEANEAYQVLSDDKKRAQYDQFGSGFENFAGGQGQQGGFGGFDFSGFQQGGADFDFGNLNDIFGDFFGGGFGGGGRQQDRRGRDISTEITLSFTEAVFGGERAMLLTKTSLCYTCKGSGSKHGTKTKKCDSCNGQGKIHEIKRSFLGNFTQVRVCDVCMGVGTVPEEKCGECRGVGVVKRQEEIKFVIPAGIRDGEMIRLTGHGEAVAKGGIAGDLYIKINVGKHIVFKREGNDLMMDLNLKLTEAMLGKSFELETLDGKVDVTIPEGTVHGEVLRVRGKGVPSKSKRGDILMKVNIIFPRKLSRKAREAIEKLKEEGM